MVTPAPTALPPARTLEAHLGDYALAISVMAAVPGGQPATWQPSILGLWGPNGTRAGEWKGIDAAERPRLLSDTILRYAGEGLAFHALRFNAFHLETITRHLNPPAPRIPGGSSAAPGGTWHNGISYSDGGSAPIAGTEAAAVRASGRETPGKYRSPAPRNDAAGATAVGNLLAAVNFLKPGAREDPAAVDR